MTEEQNMTYPEYLKEQLKDPEFKKHYDELLVKTNTEYDKCFPRPQRGIIETTI